MTLFLKYPFFILLILGFLLYGKTLFFDYVYLDDTLLVEESRGFLSQAANVGQAFRQEVFSPAQRGSGIFYRPMLTVSFLWDGQLNKLTPYSFRLTNILIHVLASYLTYLFFLKFSIPKINSFIFSLIFLIHPTLAAAVAWIPGRNDSLLSLFILLSFLFYSSYTENRRKIYLVFHLVTFFLALLTKETAIILPVLCLYYSIFLSRKFNSSTYTNEFGFACHCDPPAGGEAIPSRSPRDAPSGASLAMTLNWVSPDININYAFLSVFWVLLPLSLFILRSVFVTNAGSYTISDMAANILLQSSGIFVYVGKAFLPLRLSVYPHLSDAALPLWLGVLFSGVILIGLILNRKGWRMTGFGLLWFLLFLIPTFVIREKYSDGILREHRMYLPIIGLFILFSQTVYFKLLVKNKSVFFVSSGIIIIFLLMATYRHSENFKDGLSFWRNAVETSPTSAVAHFNLGTISMDKRDYSLSQLELTTANLLAPDMLGVHNNLGVLYMRQNMYEKAVFEFEKELEINPAFEMAKRNLEFAMKQKTN